MSDLPEVPTLPTPQLPLPPSEISFRNHVEQEWERIIRFWKNGWADESRLSNLESLIEFERVKIFDNKMPDSRPFDWGTDWIQAKHVHDFNVDVVKNRKQHVDDVKKMWFEWTERSYTYFSDVSLEALKSMVLIDGAAIIAALTVLSGQIAQPWHAAVLVAKLTVFTSVVSLLMMGIGHSVLFLRMDELVSRVRSVLIGHTKHNKLYAIPRYLKRYGHPATQLANLLIFGSIAVFGISAFFSALILLLAAGPSALP
ncbi:hypothetical protein [Mesorhizobium sp. B4-1-4]|uniref:hypothetical protein n=1 Tax=Mesorhizobium sp. B4-1-4 TaxID=2589888 RepID=UPI00112D5AC4|nr:hypothetical protein [Mesorhizobium sp. B4-1-4]UCI32534.1 hypothetical protein FJW03_03505 [Mesorhizobium sp. B4-1-4]